MNMKHIIAFSVAAISILGFSSTLSVAQDAKWGSAEEAKTIVTLEATWLSKVCAPPPDLSFIAKDFHGTRRNGTRYGQEIATLVSDAAEKATARDCRLGDVDVRFFNDSTANAYGSEGWINIAPDGKETQFCEAWTDTFIKREGKWYLVSAQDNIVACEQWWPTLRSLRTILPNYEELFKNGK